MAQAALTMNVRNEQREYDEAYETREREREIG